MNVLIVGSGGREHAISWSIKKNPDVKNLFVSPGNGGTHQIARNVNLKIEPPFSEVIEFCRSNNIDLVVVGPEAPLVDGITDSLEREGITVWGPKKEPAMIEGSKVFAKELMRSAGVPTAEFEIFSSPQDAVSYIEKAGTPIVVKADGLAAGKGVIVADDTETAKKAVETIMVEKKFGKAGDRVVIEKKLTGQELSVFAVVNGTDYSIIGFAQDYKRAYDGDRGPNTGGMGTYSPVPFLTDSLVDKIKSKIIEPTINTLADRGTPYTGFLYAGLMIDENGDPYVLEFNCRLGDPEAQVILPLLKDDLLSIIESAVSENVKNIKAETRNQKAVCVVLASGGYPEKYEKGKEITGNLENTDEVLIFHAGTKFENGRLLTSGGRVLNVVGLGKTFEEARKNAYDRIQNIKFEKMFYRNDIGMRAVEMEKQSQ